MSLVEWDTQKSKTRNRDEADAIIESCISLERPQSFFLFAGAGSGKTGALVAALEFIRNTLGNKLQLDNRKVAVITYTNAAADEINRRSQQFPCFAISTIHSFSWELIKPFQQDIKIFLIQKLEEDIATLEAKKSGKTRDSDLNQKQKRLENVRKTFRFSYSPTGANSGSDSLSHGDVLAACTNFLMRPLMQQILISQFPVIFIDESQDTNKHLIEVLLEIQKKYASQFMLGLFGDMMQRIYLDGKESLERAIGPDWAIPALKTNYRSPKRIVSLINLLRNDVDGQIQKPKENATEGTIRVFITHASANKNSFEIEACKSMANITGDKSWAVPGTSVKMLTLEHKMAAERLGFDELYNALDVSKKLRQRAFEKLTPLDPRPQVADIAFLTEILLPLVDAHKKNDDFGIMHLLKKHSPLLLPSAFDSGEDADKKCIPVSKAKEATQALFFLWDNGADPDLKSIILSLEASKLLDVPSKLKQGVASASEVIPAPEIENNVTSNTDQDAEDKDPEEMQKQREAWEAFVRIPISQISLFYSYIKGESYFDTHQGVKGLEFQRVMVILDDEAAGGTLFSYEKLFGAKELSKTDKENKALDKDSTLTRTNRLFYVICSRAEEGLAIVIYSANPKKVYDTLVERKIFPSTEIHCC